MRVLITGIAGFVGSYLAEQCLAHGCEVHGLERPGCKKKHLAAIQNKIRIHEADLNDYAGLRRVLKESQPDRIFHLAAQSFVAVSWKSPSDTLATNIIGQAHLFEALRELGMSPLIHVAGSSEEYGMIRENEVPVTEESPLRPLSPYAVSKVAQDLLGYQYFKSYQMKIIRTRAFNHTGPRRSEVFVISNFSWQIAQIEAGLQEPVLSVGNLDGIRDFTDVRDMARAYWLCLEKCEPGEVYNICSGKGRRLSDILPLLLQKSRAKIEVRKDPARLRPSDLPIVIGNCEKFSQRTGWKPEIPFEKTLNDLLDYWRAQIKR